MPCWWVGCWLWRVGCISQDTYLLYVHYCYFGNLCSSAESCPSKRSVTMMNDKTVISARTERRSNCWLTDSSKELWMILFDKLKLHWIVKQQFYQILWRSNNLFQTYLGFPPQRKTMPRGLGGRWWWGSGTLLSLSQRKRHLWQCQDHVGTRFGAAVDVTHADFISDDGLLRWLFSLSCAHQVFRKRWHPCLPWRCVRAEFGNYILKWQKYLFLHCYLSSFIRFFAIYIAYFAGFRSI